MSEAVAEAHEAKGSSEQIAGRAQPKSQRQARVVTAPRRSCGSSSRPSRTWPNRTQNHSQRQRPAGIQSASVFGIALPRRRGPARRRMPPRLQTP
eukprot:scaffold273_cov242-Pinguiococcus_pyrenoidosus.AAC.27